MFLHSFSRPAAALVMFAGLALLLTVLPGAPARAADLVSQGISVTVTGPDGQGRDAWVAIEPVDPTVELEDDDGIGVFGCEAFCDSWHAQSADFRIALPAGEYWLRFTTIPHVDEQLATEFWQDATSRQTATKVVVSAGALTPVTPELGEGSSISGTIPQAAGTAGRAFVEAWVPDEHSEGGYYRVSTDFTDTDGKFSIPGLTPGSYLIHARIRPLWPGPDPGSEGWYGSAKSAATSTPVVVGEEGIDVPGVDVTLSPFAQIRGTVTSPAYGPTRAHLRFMVKEVGGWTQYYETDSGADGTYAAPAEAGTYRVAVDAPDHVQAGFGGGPFVSAPSFTHVQTQDRTGTDVVLTPSRAIAVTRASFSGVPRVDATLTANTGSWYPADLTYSYQWLRNGWAIPGATRKAYAAQPADVGRWISVRVTASKAGVPAGTSLSLQAEGRLARFRLLSPAALKGALSVGSLLTAQAPATSPEPTRIRYQWMNMWDPIPGATGRTYRLRPSDRGDYISVRITLVRRGYVTVVREPMRKRLVR